MWNNGDLSSWKARFVEDRTGTSHKFIFLFLFSFFSLAGSPYNGLLLSFVFPTYGTLFFIGGMHVIPEVNNWGKGKKATLHI
jgi:hypothetical protein